jgi:predicted nucleic-acid-binding protein
MKKKLEEVINHVQKSEKIAKEDKPLIIEKIEEWKKEDAAVGDLMTYLRQWWIEVEPIFAELGLI